MYLESQHHSYEYHFEYQSLQLNAISHEDNYFLTVSIDQDEFGTRK